MGGLARALGRLLVMAGVMAGVVVACLVAGFGTTIAVALGIVLAGIVGLAGAVRRRPAAEAVDPFAIPAQPAAAVAAPEPPEPASVESMDPRAAEPADPESLMPRWRRPSLLEARRADPARPTTAPRSALRFGETQTTGADLRMVRYAVVTVLDRPDEVHGARVTDLGAGDEVQVVAADGSFLEIVSPEGERGWIHRTTVGPMPSTGDGASGPADAEDALTALLVARGLQ